MLICFALVYQNIILTDYIKHSPTRAAPSMGSVLQYNYFRYWLARAEWNELDLTVGQHRFLIGLNKSQAATPTNKYIL